MATHSIPLGRELFMFDGFNHWSDTAPLKFQAAKVTSNDVICIDALGRICNRGAHFELKAETQPAGMEKVAA